MIDTNSPSLTSTLTRRSTYERLVPCAYDFSMLRSEISAPPAGCSMGSSGTAVLGAGASAEREKKPMHDFTRNSFCRPTSP